MVDLFGEGGKAEKKKRAKGEKDEQVLSRVVRLERLFIAKHEARWGCAPMQLTIARKRKHLKDLAAISTDVELEHLMDIFFTTIDQQVTRSDYSVEAFYRLVQHLRLLDKKSKLSPRTTANLEAAARVLNKNKGQV